MNTIRTTIISLIIFVLGNLAIGDSYYSSIGLGTPYYFVSPKAAGMGGAGISVVDRFALNGLNPAAFNIGNITTISVDMKYEIISNNLDESQIRTLQGNAAGFQFVVPLKSYLKLIAGLQPLTDSRYILSETGTTEYADFTRLVRGSGGLNSAKMGIQYILKEWIAVGALAHFRFGSFNEEWKTEFFEPGYETVSDKLNSHLWGGGYQIGVLYRPRQTLGLGLSYSSGSTLRANTQNEVGFTIKSRSDQINIRYPGALGIGFSVETKKVLLAADYYIQYWNKYALDGKKQAGFRDYNRVGVGMEYQGSKDPFASYLRRVSLRVGGYLSQMPFVDQTGDRVLERFVTLGFGLPFIANRGRVDFTIEIGQRDSGSASAYGEKIIRFYGSVTGGELWFQRRKR